MVASLRVGGVPRSFDDHVLLLGDAAGMIDPMTGTFQLMTDHLYVSAHHLSEQHRTQQ